MPTASALAAPIASRVGEDLAVAGLVPLAGAALGQGAAADDSDIDWVRTVLAAVIADLEGTPFSLDSGLDWAAAILASDARRELVITTSQAGWIPPAARLPRGTRLLSQHPDGDRWATVDDPVRPLLELARAEEKSVAAVATTHTSRAHVHDVGRSRFVALPGPGHDQPADVDQSGWRNRFELVASPERVAHIRSLDEDAAYIQMVDIARDALAQTTYRPVLDAGRQIISLLEQGAPVPDRLVGQLSAARHELVQADSAERVPSSSVALGDELSPSSRVVQMRLATDAAEAVLAAAVDDIDTAISAWTVGRFRVHTLNITT